MSKYPFPCHFIRLAGWLAMWALTETLALGEGANRLICAFKTRREAGVIVQ